MYTVLASEVSNLGSQLQPIMDEISSAVSTTDITALLGKAVAFGIPFFLVMFGARKLVNVAQSAIRNGSIRI